MGAGGRWAVCVFVLFFASVVFLVSSAFVVGPWSSWFRLVCRVASSFWLVLFVGLLLSCRLSVVLGRWRPNWARPARGTRLPGAWESPPGAGEHGLALEGTG